MPAIVQPASASPPLTATTANWLPRSRRRAFAFGISGSVVKVAIGRREAAPAPLGSRLGGGDPRRRRSRRRRAARVVSRSLPSGVTAGNRR
ncbi:MAG: hypothetical protein IPP07_08435 [Holophagales bacterium]|nr:hypothetical protein [Holophagales bacterium]